MKKNGKMLWTGLLLALCFSATMFPFLDIASCVYFPNLEWTPHLNGGIIRFFNIDAKCIQSDVYNDFIFYNAYTSIFLSFILRIL
ncbi:MAG: hypothetical protein ACFFBD_09900 [Candidatus Hodarchaeota archaeon]